jgi:hypothetical protein
MTTLPYRRSAKADKCRWQWPDDDGRCARCGWPLYWVADFHTKDGIVAGHWKHRRPPLPMWLKERLAWGTGRAHKRAWRLANPGIRFPHHVGPRLTLSEETTPAEHESGRYVHTMAVRHNTAFRHRGGAGGRLIVPTVEEWTAWR